MELPATATWVADNAALQQVVAAAGAHDAYALDTEFHRERTYFPNLALVQLAWPGGIALIDPFEVDLTALRPLLEGPAVAVLHAADQDLEVLERACGCIPARLFDTQVAAGFVGFSTPSLATLCERLLDLRLPKGDRLTDWTRRPLTNAQREYAAADVAYLLELRGILVDRLNGRGRLAWAEEECALLLQRSRAPQDPDKAWWRIKDGRGLRGASRGVAQAVAAWRERKAAAADMPTRFVLSDMALLGIIHRRPRSRAELEGIRGLDSRQLRSGTAEEVVSAVETGLELPEDAVQLPPVEDLDRGLRPAITLVSAWIAQLGRNLHVDPTLLGTRADVQALLRGDADARLASGWRAELVGEPVRRLVAGEAALAFDGDDLVLEPRISRRASDGDPPEG